MGTIKKLKYALKPTIEKNEKFKKAEELYWLYRTAKDNPKELEIAFLLEANRLQKSIIEEDENEQAILSEIYIKLKQKQLDSGDGKETYTTGYRNGHTNGQMELLEKILDIDVGLRSEGK